MSGQQHAPAALYLRERPGTHFTGGCVGLRAGLDGRKISSPLGFDPGLSSPSSVATPTELPGPQPREGTILLYKNHHILHSYKCFKSLGDELYAT